MRTQVENLENCKAKLTLEFDQVASDRAYNFVIRDLGKQVRVAGFMPGKVPKSIIEERVGRKEVEYRAVEKLLSENLGNALKQENLELLSRPLLENFDYGIESKFSVSLLVELRPEVKLGEYKNLEIQVPRSDLKDMNPEKLAIEMAKNISPWTEITDNPLVEPDDLITMDFAGNFIDGTEIKDSNGKGVKMVVKPENFAPNVVDQLIGTPIGETKEIKSSFPDDYEEFDLAGKDAIFTVTVSKIERKLPPPINEDFAKSVGRENLEELYKSLEEELGKSKKTIENKRAQSIVLEKVLKNSQVEIPEWLVQREAEAQLQHTHNDHEHTDEFNHEHEEPDQKLLQFSKDKLKFNFVLAEIARQENIQLTQEELSAYVRAWIQFNQTMDPNFKFDGNVSPALVNYLSEELLFSKISEWLVQNAQIELIEETEESLKKLEQIKKAFPYLNN